MILIRYPSLQELVDHIFPPVNIKADEAFNDYNFWKQPLPQVNLPVLNSPPKSSTSSPILPSQSSPPRQSPAGSMSLFPFRGRMNPVSDLEMGTVKNEIERGQIDIESEDSGNGDVGLADYAAELDDLAASIDFSEHPF